MLNFLKKEKTLLEKIGLVKTKKRSLFSRQPKNTFSISDASKLLKPYWNKIEPIIINQLLKLAESQLKNDALLEACFSTAYESLPAPIRILTTKESFIEHCLQRKKSLLKKLKKTKK